MNGFSETVPIRLMRPASMAMLRTGCAALLFAMTGCGGGGGADAGGAAPPGATSTPETETTQPLAAVPLLVRPAQSIDGGASGNPVDLRVVRSINGDGFAVWLANDGTRRNLWANRYQAATRAWGNAVSVEASDADIDEFDLTVDASGNAVAAWREVVVDPTALRGLVMSARFSAAAGAWGAPVLLNADGNADGGEPHVASAADGTVLAVYRTGLPSGGFVQGRVFDPASGTWQPQARVEQNTTGTGHSFGVALLPDSGSNAVAAWINSRTGASIVNSNYFSRSGGGWEQLPADAEARGVVPGSFTSFDGENSNVQLAATPGGSFVIVWQRRQTFEPDASELRFARFMPATRTWSASQTLVPNSGQNIQLQRTGSDAAGNMLVLFTENAGTRTALKAIRVLESSIGAVEIIDRAVGGGAARADLGVDPQGAAIAIWQQFEGGRPDDGSRSNIAINRFDGNTGAWRRRAVFAERQPGNAISPRASAAAGQALLGWIQAEGGVNRVKALLLPLDRRGVGG